MATKKSVLIIFILMLVFSVVNAQDPIVSHTAIKDKAILGDKFIFSVTVENPNSEDQSYRFFIPSYPMFEWVFEHDENAIDVDAHSSKTFDLIMYPYDQSKKDPGNYGITLNLTGITDKTISVPHLFNLEVLSFDKALTTELELPEVINPRRDSVFRVNIRSNYASDIENLKVAVKSDYFNQAQEIGTLTSNSEMEKEFLVQFDGIITPGENDIHVLIYKDNVLVYDKVDKITLTSYTEIKEISSPESGFLYSKANLERTNNGNSISYETYSYRLNWFERLFTQVSEDPTTVTKGNGYYVYEWDFSLKPGESKTINVKIDYRASTIIALLVLIIAGVLYWYLRKDISLSKRIISVQHHPKDSVTTVNVMLRLKNKSKTRISNIKLTDMMSNVVEKPFNLTGHRPTKVTGDAATRLLWDIPNLEGKSEMIITYSVKCKSRIIGHIPMPKADLMYVKDQRTRRLSSNRPKMFK